MPAMLLRIVRQTCQRSSTQSGSVDSQRLLRLIDAGAFTEAALAMIALELPQWQLRRIAYDDGDWYCALSRQRALPEWLDQLVETSHASLPLAILGAYLDTLQQVEAMSDPSRPSVPQIPVVRCEPQCCDNFA
jgi:hypothetical protein